MTNNHINFLDRGTGIFAGMSFVITLIYWVSAPTTTAWEVAALWVSVVIIAHAINNARNYVILPGLMCIVASISWLLAPAFSYAVPPSNTTFQMIVPPEVFFSYAIPATLALWLGVHLPIAKKHISAIRGQIHKLMPTERHIMDVLIGIGLFAYFLSGHVPSGLGFLFYSLAQLRFVGVLVWVIADTPGWKLRTIIVYGHLLLHVATGGIFYEFVLWAGSLLVVFAYRRRWRLKLFLVLLGAIVIAVSLNTIKPVYRAVLATHDLNALERVSLLGEMVVGAFDDKEQNVYETSIGDKIVRFNQGWILARVINRVPSLVPYADGDTVKSAVKQALLPRLFFPEKGVVNSKVEFERYVGIWLGNSTSMALGIAGDMYVNFGRTGILAVFIYGLLVGFAFNGFSRLAAKNPIWWAWAPFVLLATIQAEWNLSEILNYTVKSALVMAATLWVMRKAGIRIFAKNR